MSVTPAKWAEGALGKDHTRAPRVIFGQVHEDAEVELAIARDVEGLSRCFVIGSGGCTALALLTLPGNTVHAVDINPAQIHLIELKRTVLARLSSASLVRDAFLRDGRPALDEVLETLPETARAYWTNSRGTLLNGLLRCGLVEEKLRVALFFFRTFIHSQRLVRTLLEQTDLDQQRKLFWARCRTWRWNYCFSLAMHPLLLRLVYGRAFVERLPKDAGEQLRSHLDHVLQNHPNATNGYLWQTLLQEWPSEADQALPPFLRDLYLPEVQRGIARLKPEWAEASAWLADQPPRSIGFFALSNILEMASSSLARTLADEVLRCALPGACVVTRSIFAQTSPLLKGGNLLEDSQATRAMQARDRSPICRHVRVFRVAA